MNAPAKNTPVRDHILALAQQHGISTEPTDLDQVAMAITRCSGEKNRLDDAGIALAHLAKFGYISNRDSQVLLLRYFDECEANHV